jgi:hypothetical protein
VADDQQEVLPALGYEVLNERVGEHRPARQQMQDIGAAILAAQPIVGGAGIKESDARGFRQAGDRQQRRR